MILESRFQNRSVVSWPDIKLLLRDTADSCGSLEKGCSSAWAFMETALKLMSNIFSFCSEATDGGT